MFEMFEYMKHTMDNTSKERLKQLEIFKDK